ncbi:MAG TPA: hypothetical protein VFN67_39755 [Polyangiales bacterium]|nr:hypothetical protein [Polyangiales bacterium]
MSARAGSGLNSLRAVLVLALLASSSALVWTGHARAQSELVLLLVPQTPDPALVELFHRVEAELRLHEFRTEVLVASPGDSTEALLGAQASAQRAFAAIAIVEQTPSAMLHVWIVDARTGLTRQYQVEQRGGQEPTNVVAVRAVDLLRAHRALWVAPGTSPPSAAAAAGSGAQPKVSLTETGKPAGAAIPDGRSAGASPTRERTDVPRDRDRDAADDRAEDGERADPELGSESQTAAPGGTPTFHYKPTLLQIAAEATGISLGRRMGWSFGPSLGVWLTLGDRWRVGVVGVAPLLGAALHARFGEPKIVQELVWVELGARLVRTGILQLSAAAGFGLHWLQGYGKTVEPLLPQDASVWSWTGSLAARADVMLAEHWSLGMTLRARIFLPPVEVAVGTELARLATPAIEGGLGLSFWL